MYLESFSNQNCLLLLKYKPTQTEDFLNENNQWEKLKYIDIYGKNKNIFVFEKCLLWRANSTMTYDIW